MVNLFKHCWFLLYVYVHIHAILAAVLVVGLQVAIAVLGNFRSGRLEKYVGCFEDSIGYGNGTLPSNITFPVSACTCVCILVKCRALWGERDRASLCCPTDEFVPACCCMPGMQKTSLTKG